MDKICFELDGNIPPKKNRPRIFKRGKGFIRIPSKSYEKWHEKAMYEIGFQVKEFKRGGFEFPIVSCDLIDCVLYYGTLITKDNTNTVESVHDLLVDAGILSDDNWKVTGVTRQTPVYRKNSPGCLIMITPKKPIKSH